MWGKLNKQFARNLNKAKAVGSRAYGGLRTAALALDHGVNMANQIYQVAKPALQAYAPEASGKIQKGITDYNFAKDKVLSKHREVQEGLGRVRNAVPELSSVF